LMRAAGVSVGDVEAAGFQVCGLPTAALPACVEPDWSSASYFYGLLALSAGGALHLPGFRQDSCQGDRVAAEWFEAWGIESRFGADGLHIERRAPRCPKRVALDFTHHPDLLQTMAVVCAASGVEARFTGIRNLKYKETDRVAAVLTELGRLRVRAETPDDDTLVIASGQPEIKPETVIQTYGDHRMALAFSMLAVVQPITVAEPAVVGKSFEGYWTSLEALGAETALR
ncbi:MAG: hypothetical protein K2F84_04200, partial [Bacteroidales bacterium]|nr:hypothetical protein [Bacteroidales bacterium]